MKRIVFFALGTILIALAYYLFVRSYEYEVSFKARTLPGDVIETIRIWHRSLEQASMVEVDSFHAARQLLEWNGSTYKYVWKFDAAPDSMTQIRIQISEPGRSFRNKLLIPLTEQGIERDAKEMATRFYEILQEHLRITSVKLVGEAHLDSMWCACRSLSTDQIEKANGMMQNYSLITSFIDVHGLKANGPPMVRVTKWDHELGQLSFMFCFPVNKPDTVPESDVVTIQAFDRERVLKAEYRGNYITSDRAWYSLIEYAQARGYVIRGLPIERFYDNPNLGLNESNWRAEVYLPFTDEGI